MKITYDTEADAIYIQFMEAPFSTNKEVADGVILDIGKDNEVLGIEVLDASLRFPPETLAHVDIQMPLHLAGAAGP
ncbi:MAG: Uncharacterized protein YuzE [Chloroflexi bacterium]|jgi:uncharacterized protein YuzE|nr:MAG: Uncharacterized protein YuzE [Chloroflexota bacterium]